MFRTLALLILWLCVGALVACDGGTTATTTSGSPSTTLKGAPDEKQPTVLPDGSLVAAVSPVPTLTVLPGGGLTLKEGYALVAPLVAQWQKDAVLVAAFNEEGKGMDAKGRAARWYYQAVSAATGKRRTWLAVGDPRGTSVSNDEDVGSEMATMQAGRPLPLDQAIDSDKLMEIARQNGATTSTAPVGIAFAAPPNKTDPLVYNLLFQDGKDVLRLRVDARTGTILSTEKG